MVLALDNFSTWLDADNPAAFRLRAEEFARPGNGHAPEEAACLGDAVSTIRTALREYADILRIAGEFREKNKSDPVLTGFDSLSDKQLLTQMDKLAAVSLIHSAHLSDISAGMEFLMDWRRDFKTWTDDSESLLRELRQHEENLKWVTEVTLQWSEDLGSEYDRRHPDVADLPITLVDLGPSNSANLPSVL
ncbi:MAG: hypothetical protein HS101_04160 [Planctomycetia bacterium]|jgi:hypothetical protein|nr:hypothetical protein [Planctomycetia bacterium]MCC7316760.1 hypothetical protein [Planctomycetota bacterium]OQZ06057.1 MAG: hypothetical protein B6D36_06945 [Planctomycetes bacterium UTPLA1]